MSYKQMKYYLELEDYSTAYRIAHEDWDTNPSLVWPRNSIAWLLIRMMKANANACSMKTFIQQLEEFKNLGIPHDNKKLWGAVAWPIRDIVQDSYQMQWFTYEFGDNLFDTIQNMPFDRPSESYSAMLAAFIRLGSLWPRLAEFIEWWGFGNFTNYDYRRYPEKGRLESLAEKVFIVYIGVLCREGKHREPSKKFFEGLRKMESISKEQADRVYACVRC